MRATVANEIPGDAIPLVLALEILCGWKLGKKKKHSQNWETQVIRQVKEICDIDPLPLDGHVVTQNSSSSPPGQSFFPSHSWACERQFDVCRHSTEGSLQAGVLGTMES